MPPPYLSDAIFECIFAFLSVSALCRFACVSKRFSRALTRSGEQEAWSLVESAARRQHESLSPEAQAWVRRAECGGSWLQTLARVQKLQRPLRFSSMDPSVILWNSETCASGTAWRAAWCSDHMMSHGKHFVEFELRHVNNATFPAPDTVELGVALVTGNEANPALRTWTLYSETGCMRTIGTHFGYWDGQPRVLKTDDVVVSVAHGPSAARAP